MKTLAFIISIAVTSSCTMRHSPRFMVVDTDFSKGRLGHRQQINLNDLVKFHGHLCDGLVVGAQAMQLGLNHLFPDGIVDRTNIRIVSKSSPCLADVAIYLTGGRYQYNTYYTNDSIDGLFIIQRLDNNMAVVVKLNAGVKPTDIDSLGALAVKQELSACALDSLKKIEDDFTMFLLKSDPKLHFNVQEVKDFSWQPSLKVFPKTDVINKHIGKCTH